MHVPTDANGAQWSRRHGRQAGKLREVGLIQRKLRHLLNAARAKFLERGARFPRDPDSDGRGLRRITKRGSVFAEIPGLVAGGFREPVSQRQFAHEGARRRFGGPDRAPDKRNL